MKQIKSKIVDTKKARFDNLAFFDFTLINANLSFWYPLFWEVSFVGLAMLEDYFCR